MPRHRLARRAPSHFALPPLFLFLSGALTFHSHLHAQDIFQALASGDQARIQALIAEDAAILERPGPRGLTPVDAAFLQDCQTGSDLTRFLLARGATLDPSGVLFGRSRLLLATTFGNAGMVRLLLDLGANLEAPGPTGGTVLEEAARRGRQEIVDMLLAAGADPNSTDSRGNPPMRWAVERGHESIVDALLAAGAQVDVVGGEDGMTLVHVASLYGHKGIVSALLDAGSPASDTDGKGRTPLDYAARFGHRQVAELLRERGGSASHSGPGRDHPSPYLDGRVGPGQAALWYLTNRGLAMKTSEHFLVFDPEEFGVSRPTEPGLANGFLSPAEIGGEDVVVFYSAYHGFVDEPAYIHQVVDSLKSVTYVHNAGDEFRGSEKAIFLEPHQAAEAGGIEFLTVAPMVQMSTLGYLMEVDGLRVFYQGFAADDLDHYGAELDFLSGDAPQGSAQLDLALLPIPDGGVEEARDYLSLFLQRFHPKTVALNTPPYQLSILPQGEALLRELGFTGRILVPEFPGDEFEVGGTP